MSVLAATTGSSPLGQILLLGEPVVMRPIVTVDVVDGLMVSKIGQPHALTIDANASEQAGLGAPAWIAIHYIGTAEQPEIPEDHHPPPRRPLRTLGRTAPSTALPGGPDQAA